MLNIYKITIIIVIIIIVILMNHEKTPFLAMTEV